MDGGVSITHAAREAERARAERSRCYSLVICGACSQCWFNKGSNLLNPFGRFGPRPGSGSEPEGPEPGPNLTSETLPVDMNILYWDLFGLDIPKGRC